MKITFKEFDKPTDSPYGLHIWVKPKSMEQYSMGVDTAEGIGGDASCVQVISIDSGQHVASYWNNSIDVDSFAAEVYKLAHYYNKAWTILEINNHGHALATHLTGALGGLAYPNLYKRVTFDEFTQKRTKTVGFKTTTGTKPRLIENLKSAFRDGELVTFDKYTLRELGSFLIDKKTGRMGAKGSAHDDRVMALALAWEQARQIKESQTVTQQSYSVPRQYDPATGFPI